MSKTLVIKDVSFETNKVATVTLEELVPCTGLALSDASWSSIRVGSTKTLTAVKTPVNATNQLTWESSNTTVATVQSGVVTIVGVGSATIIARCGEASSQCSINSTHFIDCSDEPKLAGINTMGLNFYEDRDYVSESNATARFRTYAMSEDVMGSAYRLTARSTSPFNYARPIPIPQGSSQIKISAAAEYNNTKWRWAVVNANEKHTYPLTGDDDNCCRRYGGTTADPVSYDSSSNPYLIIDLTEQDEAVNAFTFTVLTNSDSNPISEKTGFVYIEFS